MKRTVLLLFVISIFASNVFSQAIPKQISYQGVLKDAVGNVLTGDFAMTFKIYNDPTGGSALWTEIQAVAVANGLFNVQLGIINPITTVPFDRIHFLGITVGTGSELSPRTLLSPSPYSFMTMNILDNTITSAKILDGTIRTNDISDSSITPSKIVAGSSNGLVLTTSNGSVIWQTPTSSAHNHIGETWDAAIAWSNAAFKVTNLLNGPSIWAVNSGGGNALRGQGYGSSIAVYGEGEIGAGITGRSTDGNGVEGFGYLTGIYGFNQLSGNFGYIASSSGMPYNVGVYGEYGSNGNAGALGTGGYGVWASNPTATGLYSYGNPAGTFQGNVFVLGTISKGGGSFKIDHPLDPENKFLYHSFVESPDMMNIYNGNVITDNAGYSTVTLPNWFEAINKDFRYQLTVIGDFAQPIVSQKIQNNHFVIRTDKPNIEVSWQVTGIRQDKFAENHRIQVEVEKSESEKGKYLYPKEYGMPESLGIYYEARQQKKIPVKKMFNK